MTRVRTNIATHARHMFHMQVTDVSTNARYLRPLYWCFI